LIVLRIPSCPGAIAEGTVLDMIEAMIVDMTGDVQLLFVCHGDMVYAMANACLTWV
jgi:isopropylmalate/homocitrate/citramalate synthase